MMNEMVNEKILVAIVVVVIIIIIISVGCSCYYHHRNETFKTFRPHHPKWYKDLPETHPDVLNLYKQSEEQSKRVKKYTEKGFEKRRMPIEMWNYLKDVTRTTPREIEGKGNIFPRTSSGLPPYLIPIPPEKKRWIESQLKPILEQWSGQKLIPTSTYGPREYRKGSSLRNHVDIETTHIVSAILNISQENIRKDWPLTIKDNSGVEHEVIMKPGDMVLYESASCMHGRPKPLDGDYYVNAFIHFKPKF